MPRGQLKKDQQLKLRKLVRHAYHNVPYYNQLFKQAGITPSNIRTLEDLEKIPVTTKDDFRKFPVLERTARNIPLNSRVINKTSGSTGHPFEIHRDKVAAAKRFIGKYANYYTRGLRFSDKLVVLGPGWLPIDHIFQKFGLFTSKKLSIWKKPEEVVSEMLRFKPSAVVAYPSSLDLLCKELIEKNIQHDGIRMVFVGGESLQKHTRMRCKQALGVEPYDEYGIAELGTIALECEEYAGLHVVEHCVIPEFLNKGRKSKPGELGVFTLTNLYNYAMPFIRYESGDIGTFLEDRCSCGRSLRRIKLFGGRQSEILTLSNGRLAPGILLLGDVHCLDGVKQFKIIQNKLNMFVVHVVPAGDFTEETVEEIKTRFMHNLGDVTVKVIRVEDIPREKSGKFTAVTSKVPVNL